MKGASSRSNANVVKTKPEQVPQLKNGEQLLQSPSLPSCESFTACVVLISSVQLSSRQQGTDARKKTNSDSIEQHIFIGANIINARGVVD